RSPCASSLSLPYTTLFRSLDRAKRVEPRAAVVVARIAGHEDRGPRSQGAASVDVPERAEHAPVVAVAVRPHDAGARQEVADGHRDRKSTRLNSSHQIISYA